MKGWLARLALFALVLAAGCASGPTRDINDPTNSLVFGYIDMADAPTKVSYAWIQQVAPPTDAPYWQMGVQDGVFYSSYLPAGSYQLSAVGGSSFMRGEYRYNFGRQGNETQLRITKPGIYFLGSFKYRAVKTGIFQAGKFAIEKTKQPSEAELLKKLLDNDSELRKSAWGEKIRARLAQLNRR